MYIAFTVNVLYLFYAIISIFVVQEFNLQIVY